tara:strand:+ start:121 stop:372 length:252 start_codon:yes stop_codon:yes gene_type:complete
MSYKSDDLAYDMYCSDLQQEVEDENRWFKFWFKLQEFNSRNPKRISISRDSEQATEEVESMMKSLHRIEEELIKLQHTLNSKY